MTAACDQLAAANAPEGLARMARMTKMPPIAEMRSRSCVTMI
jgi:hypothetical protein